MRDSERLCRFKGGEPCVYRGLSEVITETVNNKNINHVTIASNGTVMPDEKSIAALLLNPDKIDIRFSVYDCVEEDRRNKIISELKNRGVNAGGYKFLYGNGKWFDSGDVYTKFNDDRDEVFKIYKSCGNHDCWTLLDDFLVNCSKIYSLLQIHNLACYEENNMVNITAARINCKDIKALLAEFNNRYLNQAPIMCGYCKESCPELEPAIQLTNLEIENYKRSFADK